uniref:Ig-like domain-containing protein n=1 Tax=Poecilia formosa TaxID=48698 RepID=A0A087X3K6_POEFO
NNVQIQKCIYEYQSCLVHSLAMDLSKASLRADSRRVPAGGSVTLTCSVDASADWRYDWFKRQTSEYSKSFMIKSGTAEQNITISEEGTYYCRGGRGDPVVFTEDSNTVTIDKIKRHLKTARITQNPSWIKIFIGERISLTCVISDGDGAQWEYEWRTTSLESLTKITGDWVFYTSISSAGDYYCRGKQKMDLHPTMWSYPIRLTVHSSKPKATLNVDLLSGSGYWDLTCYVDTSPSTWKYFWYMGEIPSEIKPGQDAAASNKQILVSQRGLYWCRGGRGEPVYYTEFSEPMKVGTNQGSGSLVSSPLMTGMVCGNLLLCGSLVLLFIFLLRKIK